MTKQQRPIKSRGEREGAKIPEGKGEFIKLGFTCNQCFHHRTVMIHIKTGLTADYKSGTHPENGDSFAKYIIQILPNATQDNVIEAVGEAHRLTLHPNINETQVVDVRN